MVFHDAPRPAATVRGMNRKVNQVDDTTLTHTNVKSKSPLKAIREHCLWCCNGRSHEVKLCSANNCPSHELRFGKRPVGAKSIRPLKIVRTRCLDCSGGSIQEVMNCKFNDCPLWTYRSGRNPKLIGKRPANRHSFVKNTASARVSADENNCVIDRMEAYHERG